MSEFGGTESFSRVQQSLLVAQEPGLTSGGGEEESDSVVVLETGDQCKGLSLGKAFSQDLDLGEFLIMTSQHTTNTVTRR